MSGLEGIRVLEFPDPKTCLAGRLLADLGADVVLVEPPAGCDLRRAPPLARGTDTSIFFAYFNGGKRSVQLNLAQGRDAARFLRLVEGADVVIEAFQPGHLASLGLADETLMRVNPGLVLASLTAFGRSGPFRDYKASDIVAWAMGGLMALTGDPEREPLVAPALQAYQWASMWLTVGVQASLYRRLKTGQGARIDLSLQEAVFDISETAHTFYLCNREIVKRSSGDHPLAAPFKVFKSADGHAFVGLTSQQQWSDLLEWMRAFGVWRESMGEPDLTTLNGRVARRRDVNTAVAEWAAKVTNEELFEGGSRRGIPNAPVRSVSEVVDDEQLRYRRFFVPFERPAAGRPGPFPAPQLPFRGRDGPRPAQRDGPPEAGQHTEAVIAAWAKGRRAWPAPSEAARVLPLEGVRVVEFCWHVAGPMVGRVLSDLGATVIKVEPREMGDPGRMLPPFPGRTPRVNGSYTFQDVNRNKQSVTVNLKRPEGQALAHDLAAWADVVTENFTGGTLARLGLAYDDLSRKNPRVILCSLNGYGQTGPRASWPSYHPTSAALSGLTDLFGYDGGPPLGFGHSHMDYVAGMFGAIGVLDALLRRTRDGRGDHIDVSQLECGVALLGPEVLQWAVNNEVPLRAGNRSGALGALVQGCYRCKGDDQWIVITAHDENMLGALQRVTGPGGTTNAGQSVAGLEEQVAAWVAGLDPWEAFHALQRAGVPAGVVSHGPDLVERDEHLRARGAIAAAPHAELGAATIVQCPLVMNGARLAVRSAAPLVGQDTERVVRTVCQRSEEEYLDLVVKEVV